MIVILAHLNDSEAEWLMKSLIANKCEVQILYAEFFCIDYSISYSPNSSSIGRIKMHETNKHIDCLSIDLIINRLHIIYPYFWDKSSDKDKNYVMAEMNAFMAGWLKSWESKVANPIECANLSSRFDNLETCISRIQAFDFLYNEIMIKNSQSEYLEKETRKILVIGNVLLGNYFNEDETKRIILLLKALNLDIIECHFYRNKDKQVVINKIITQPTFTNFNDVEITNAINQLISKKNHGHNNWNVKRPSYTLTY